MYGNIPQAIMVESCLRIARNDPVTCEFCGCAIFSVKDLLCVSSTGDIIHEECWPDYAAENAKDFVMYADEEIEG